MFCAAVAAGGAIVDPGLAGGCRRLDSRSISRRWSSNVCWRSPVARRNSPMIFPIFRANSGSFSGPNTTRTTTKIMTRCGMLNIGVKRAASPRGCLALVAYPERPPSERRFCIIEEGRRPVKRPNANGHTSARERDDAFPIQLSRGDYLPLIETSSTSKISVAPGPMSPPAPR